MPIERRRPPTQDRRRFADVSLGQRLDTLEDSLPKPDRQGYPRRKRAAGPRPLGPGEVAALDALDAPQGQYLTRSIEPEVTHLSGTTSYDFFPPNWRRLGFVLGQVFEDWSKAWGGTDGDRCHIARGRRHATRLEEHRP